MKMTPFNIGIFVVCVILGVILGMKFPGFGLILIIPVIILVIVILFRNKSGAMAGPEATAEALKMVPPPGQARLFVMRKGFVGGQQGMGITIDGNLHSQIRSKYFLMADVEPGTHSVKAKMASGTEGAARTHDVALNAGDVVLLDMKLNMGVLQGSPDFTEVRDPVQARQMMQGCKLVLWKPSA